MVIIKKKILGKSVTMNEEIDDGILVDGVLMHKVVGGVSYARCFQCGKFFTPTIIDMQLQLFCSKECEAKSDEYWKKIINESDL